MNRRQPRKPSQASGDAPLTRIADHEVELPNGVSIADWALERRTLQNPRIRSLLGCVGSLESVNDSNYAILHCSPQRLHEVWGKVKQVAILIEEELAPLFERESCIPEVESDRQKTIQALAIVDSTVLRELGEFPAELRTGHMKKARKLLCVSIGKLEAFLQDALARTLASDPRSRFDADYFLSRRFPHDVEEAEWLAASVEDLEGHLGMFRAERITYLVDLAAEVNGTESEIDLDDWDNLLKFLDRLDQSLVPQLREVLSLRGIRFDEMEILDRYTSELPMISALVRELGFHTRALSTRISELVDRDSGTRAEAATVNGLLHVATNRKLSSLLVELDEKLSDLEAFIPFWRQEIGQRRALMLRPQSSSGIPSETGEKRPGNDHD